MLAVRPEEKSVIWIKNIVTKLTNVDQLVRDPCAKTFNTSKACMMFLKSGTLIEGRIVPGYFKTSVPVVVELI